MVDKFNDGHGTHKEEKGSTGFTKVLLDNLAHGISHLTVVDACESRNKRGWVDHKDGPADYEHKQGYRSLVDFSYAFNGYEKIADNECQDNGN